MIGGLKEIKKGVRTYRLIGVSVDLLAARRATPLYQQTAADTVDRADLEHSYVVCEDAAAEVGVNPVD